MALPEGPCEAKGDSPEAPARTSLRIPLCTSEVQGPGTKQDVLVQATTTLAEISVAHPNPPTTTTTEIEQP